MIQLYKEGELLYALVNIPSKKDPSTHGTYKLVFDPGAVVTIINTSRMDDLSLDLFLQYRCVFKDIFKLIPIWVY